MQKFALADGRRFAFYWTPEHGRTHVVWEAGGIGGRFTREGGTGTYGFPSEDKTAYAYGARQTFRPNGKETRSYWSPTTGTRTMNGKGAIFSRWVDLGHATTLGFPTTDETAQADGSVTLKFSSGAELRWTEDGGVERVR